MTLFFFWTPRERQVECESKSLGNKQTWLEEYFNLCASLVGGTRAPKRVVGGEISNDE